MSAANDRRWTPKLAAIDANLLVALDALLQEVSVTRAARRMGVTQSAMSQTLSRLRSQLDDPLLVRAGRGMEPTPFARRIAGRLRAAIAELEAVVHDRPAFDPATTPRRFVVAMVDYLASVLLPPLHERVSSAAPGVDLAVHSLDGDTVSAKLEAGAVDLYVGVLGEAERGLESALLHRDPFRVVVRAGHPLLADPSAERYVAFGHVHVSPRRDSGSIVERALAEAGLERRIAAELPYFGLLPALLERSDLVATVPERLARLFRDQHGLALLHAPIPLPPIDVHLAWHPRFDGEPGSAWLRSQLEAVDRADALAG